MRTRPLAVLLLLLVSPVAGQEGEGEEWTRLYCGGVDHPEFDRDLEPDYPPGGASYLLASFTTGFHAAVELDAYVLFDGEYDWFDVQTRSGGAVWFAHPIQRTGTYGVGLEDPEQYAQTNGTIAEGIVDVGGSDVICRPEDIPRWSDPTSSTSSTSSTSTPPPSSSRSDPAPGVGFAAVALVLVATAVLRRP